MNTTPLIIGFPRRRRPSVLHFAFLLLLLCGSASAQRTMTGGSGIGKMSYFTCPSMGAMRFPVIIVKYQDVGLCDTEESVMRHFDEFFNKEGYDWNGATGSVRDYFICASAGRFTPRFDILGVVQLERERTYYGAGEGTIAGHPDEMVIEGVKALADKVDFSVYDNNGDGYVDNVIVIYAGNAERFGAGTEAVLPTSYMISFNKYDFSEYMYGYEQDGLHFDSYTVTSETAYDRYDGLGTFLHEFSHALGLADEYNVYATSATYTPMYYDLMDVGMYNNDSRTPPTYSAFERYALGWIDLEVIDGPCDLSLDALDTSNKGYIIPVSDKEFFIIENRQKHGWDAYLPGQGMLVWHIDYDANAWYANAANREKAHQRIKLIKPTTLRLTLTPWDGHDLGLPLSNIRGSNGRVTAKVAGGSTGIDIPQTADAAISYTVSASGHTITAAAAIRVFDISGRLVGQGAEVTVASPGVYIVRSAQEDDSYAQGMAGGLKVLIY